MVTLKIVTENEKNILWNICQKYLYEMTQYYLDEMDKNGNYQYRYFDSYFTEPERKAYLIFYDAALAGFAMLNPYSYIGHKPDMVIAEFCISHHIGESILPQRLPVCYFICIPDAGRLKSMKRIPMPKIFGRK